MFVIMTMAGKNFFYVYSLLQSLNHIVFIQVKLKVVIMIFRYLITCGSDGDVRIYDGFSDDDPESFRAGDTITAVTFKVRRKMKQDRHIYSNHVILLYLLIVR